LKLRVDSDRPIDIVRDVTRQFDPDVTDKEIVAHLRALADEIEAENRAKVAS